MKWTTERPTEPGDYWLSQPPEKRVSQRPARQVVVLGDGAVFTLTGELLTAEEMAGAQWAKRQTPPDPFAEPVPVEMYRMSDDAMTPNLRLILSVELGAVVLYEADMTSRSATAKETAVHDKIIMSPADARWLREALQQADLNDPPEVTR